jgi:hypothetical protein
MSLTLVTLALLLGTSSALAFDTRKLGQWGSLSLDDLTPVIANSAQLQQQINEALSEGNKRQRRRDVLRNALSGSVEKSWRPSSVAVRL